MRRANVISGSVLLVFGIVLLFWIIPWQIEAVEGDVSISPRLVPQICAIFIAGLAALLLLNALREPALTADTPADSPTGAAVDEEDPFPIDRSQFASMFAVTTLILTAILAFIFVHPAAGAIILVCGIMLYMGERRILMLVSIPAVLMLITYLLFYRLLGTAIE